MSSRKQHNYIPLIIAISIVVGILVGNFYANYFTKNRLSVFISANSKISDMLYSIDDRYVDSIDINDLGEKALPHILSELDPHSTYTSAKKVEEEMQELKGAFSGIGVVFSIINDTARIVQVVAGGPSEDVGLMPGDRIIKVDGKPFVGDFLDNDYAMDALRGPDKSKIKISVRRTGKKNLLTYEVTRGNVPVKTVDTYAMLNNNTGYIRIKTFGEKTYEELLVALANLNSQGCKNLVVDLRENGGGYMDAAIKIANQFLPKNKMIVYTEGRKSKRVEYFSDGRGDYQNVPLVVLVNENTASASEIFAAAIQDNDRGTIIGHRTFGKGLVQEPIQFADGSLLKLTIARYYSPSGRCLQKPYVAGDNEDYQKDIYDRYVKGELSSIDSTHLTGEEHKTLRLGRTVYGGGGVMPDVFIPLDTSDITSYLIEAIQNNFMLEYAYQYADTHRADFAKYDSWKQLETYLKKEKLVDQFANYAEKEGLKKRNLLIKQSYRRMERLLIASVISYIFDDKSAALYQCQSDEYIARALSIIKQGKTIPEKAEEDKP